MRFYNDSKATSVDATLKALEALADGEGKTVLILGGRGKNAPYSPLIELIQRSVRKVIVLGEDADNIRRQLEGVVAIENADGLDQAAAISAASALSGDNVLLAPACASFDMFKSFEERGDRFKEAVRRLEAQAASGSSR